jgi:hypothetical protein
MIDTPPIGRVYRMVWWFRAVVFLVGGAFVVYELTREDLQKSLRWTTTLGGISIGVSAVFLIAKAFTSTVEFSADSITSGWIFYTRSVEYSRIRGRREFVVQGEESTTRYLRLETTDGSRPFDVGKNMYAFDERFWTWYRALPDLDAGDQVRGQGSDFGLV